MSMELTEAQREAIGRAYLLAATWNRGGFRPRWERIGKEMQERHIERGLIVVEAYEKMKQQAEEVKP